MQYIGEATISWINPDTRNSSQVGQFYLNANTKKSAIDALRRFVANIPVGLTQHHELYLEVRHDTLMDCDIVWQRSVEVSKNGKLIWIKN